MADEQYLKQHLHALEQHMRVAIADIVRAKPAEPLAGLIAALVRQRPAAPATPPASVFPAAAAKLAECSARPMSAPAGREFSASHPALLLQQPVAGELEAARLRATGSKSPHKGPLKLDAVAGETAPKPEAGSTMALETEVKRLKAEVERLQTVNTRAEAENKRLKAGQDSSTRYQDAVYEWAQHGGDILYDLRLGAVACALMQIGPATIELDEQKQEVDETKEALGRARRADPEDVLTTTRLEHLLEDAMKLADAANERSKAARSYHDSTIRTTARSMVSCLAADRVRYAEALASAQEVPGEQSEFDNVMELFAGLANKGALEPGDEADAKLPHEARLRRVKVVERASSPQAPQQSLVEGENDVSPETHQQRPDAADVYNVSVHTVVQVSNMKYEEGFETSDKQIVQVPRAHLNIKKTAKVRQKLSQVSREDWSRRKAAERADQAAGSSPSFRRRSSTGRPLFQSLATRANIFAADEVAGAREGIGAPRASEPIADEGPPSKSLEYLLLLYADAERIVPELHALGASVQKTIVVGGSAGGNGDEFQVKVAPLKGLHRAIEKCIQKYDVRRGTRALNLGLDSPEPHCPWFRRA